MSEVHDVVWNAAGDRCFRLVDGEAVHGWACSPEQPRNPGVTLATEPTMRWTLDLDGRRGASMAISPDARLFAITWYEEQPYGGAARVVRWGYTVFERWGDGLVPMRRFVERRSTTPEGRARGPVFSACGRVVLTAVGRTGHPREGSGGELIAHDLDLEVVRRVPLEVPLVDGMGALLELATVAPERSPGRSGFVRSQDGRFSAALNLVPAWWNTQYGHPIEPDGPIEYGIGDWEVIDHATGRRAANEVRWVLRPGFVPPEEAGLARPPVFLSPTEVEIVPPIGERIRLDLEAMEHPFHPMRPLEGESRSRWPGNPSSPTVPRDHLVEGAVPWWRERPAHIRARQVSLLGLERYEGEVPQKIRRMSLFVDAPERIPPGVLDDRDFVGCSVAGSPLRWATEEPMTSPRWVAQRPVVSRLRLRETAWHCAFVGFVLSDCVFEGVRSGGPGAYLRFVACGFRHVVFRGFQSPFGIAEDPATPFVGRPEERPDPEALDAFYRDVDWAIDIRDADMMLFEVEGIPTEKIQHDPEIHCILPRENADPERLWRVPGVDRTHFVADAVRLARSRFPSCMLMAHRRSPRFEQGREAIANLRRAGLVR